MKVIVVMPAYNAESTIEKTFHDIPANCVDEIILTDDQTQEFQKYLLLYLKNSWLMLLYIGII